MNVWGWHDRIFLWWLQEVIYAHQVLAAFIWCAVLLGLPAHRRLANAVRWCFLAAALIFLACYQALWEAPWLACCLLAALSYLVLRWLLWRLPQHVAAKPLPAGLGWLRPQMAWAGAVVRDYFRADPRAVYWLDLARAVRGLPVTRTAKDRYVSAAAEDYLPGWRKACWRIVFWLVEMRIQLYRRLPTYWHDSRRSATSERPLALDEPHPRSILQAEQQAAYRKMLECWTGRSFTDYCRRDAVARQESVRQAAWWGRKNMLHREALVECSIYRTPWKPQEAALIQAASQAIDLWRNRQQYDFLWYPEAEPAMETHESPLVADTPAESAADNARSDPSLPSLTFGEDERTDGDKSSADGEQPAGKASEKQRSSTDEQDEPHEFEEDEPEDEREDEEEEEKEEGKDADQEEEDDELFRIAAPAESSAGQSPVAEPTLEPLNELTERERIRQEDLRLASRLLEAYLGVTPKGEFAGDVQRVEPYLDQSKHVRAAAILLLLYCLRRDYTGRETDRRKVDLILRLNDRFRGAPENGPYYEARQMMRSLQVDWFAEREDYSQLVAGLGTHSNLSAYEWKLLADAEAALAQQLSGQPELCDDLRHDAIDHYFQAGFLGLWTVEYAKTLLGPLAGLDDLVALLRAHSVEVTPSSSLTVADAVRQQQKNSPGNSGKSPSVRPKTGGARTR